MICKSVRPWLLIFELLAGFAVLAHCSEEAFWLPSPTIQLSTSISILYPLPNLLGHPPTCSGVVHHWCTNLTNTPTPPNMAQRRSENLFHCSQCHKKHTLLYCCCSEQSSRVILQAEGIVQVRCGRQRGGCAIKYANLNFNASDELEAGGSMESIFRDVARRRNLFVGAPLPPLPPGQAPESTSPRKSFIWEVNEHRRRVLGARTCPGLRDDCYKAMFGCPCTETLAQSDIEAAINEAGGDSCAALAWHKDLRVAWTTGKVCGQERAGIQDAKSA